MTTQLTDQRAAFLAAIIAAPDDDTLRLIFADWLEEQGEPERAEFIRVQVELAKYERPAKSGRRWDYPQEVDLPFLLRRERELMDSAPHYFGWYEWLPEIATEVIPQGARFDDHVKYRRGFVEEITCSAADWLQHGDAIRAATPLRRVRLTTGISMQLLRFGRRDGAEWCDVRLVAGLPAFARETSVPVEFHLTESGLFHLIPSKVLASVWPGIEFTLPDHSREYRLWATPLMRRDEEGLHGQQTGG